MGLWQVGDVSVYGKAALGVQVVHGRGQLAPRLPTASLQDSMDRSCYYYLHSTILEQECA